MKKILSLLTVIALTASGTSPVIGCQIKSSAGTKQANEIANKLKNTIIDLNIDSAGKQKVSYYKANIKAELNKKLSPTEINDYSMDFVSSNQLITNVLQNVTIKVKIKTASVNTDIKVKFNFKNISTIPSGDNTISAILKFNNNTYIGTNSRGLYISNDGLNFTVVGSIPNDARISAIQQIGTGSNAKIYVGTSNHSLYYSNTASGLNFTKVGSDLSTKSITSIQELRAGSNTKIYVGTTSDGLYESTNGVDFAQIKGVLEGQHINIIKIIKDIIYIGTNNSFYTSNGNGVFIKNKTLDTMSITNILKTNNKIYVGTKSRGLYSSDEGTIFSKISGDLATKGINTIQNINNKVYVGTKQNGLFISENGIIFKQIDGISKNIGINTIEQINNKIYVGTVVNGLYISNDNTGESFAKTTDVLKTGPISIIKKANNKVYVGTGYGLYYSFS